MGHLGLCQALLTADWFVGEQQSFQGIAYRQELPRHWLGACEQCLPQPSSASQWEHLNSVPGVVLSIIIVIIII